MEETTKRPQRKIFISVRHGAYDSNLDLSYAGTQQMERLANMVKKMNKENLPVTLVCSTAPRAMQSCATVAEVLGIPREQIVCDESLWGDNGHHGDRDRARELMGEHLKDNAILLVVSHLDMVTSLARHVAKQFRHESCFRESNYGCGWLIGENGVTAFP